MLFAALNELACLLHVDTTLAILHLLNGEIE